MNSAIAAVMYLLFAPFVGGLLAGVDRKITARMQGRQGPPLIQPFYDVLKLFRKETIVVRRSQNLYILYFLLFTVLAGTLFFSGGDLLLMIFALTLGGIFLVLAGYKASSPYSFIGAQRELLQMMSYEPGVLLAAIGMYMVTHSFAVADIASSTPWLILYLPLLFLTVVFLCLIKFRKSPFDLSTSHHGHQELVKGLTTEFSGRALALIEIAHWYEYVLLLGFVGLFFGSSIWLGAIAALVVFELLIFVDNSCARAKWEVTLISSWGVALVLGVLNILVLSFFLG